MIPKRYLRHLNLSNFTKNSQKKLGNSRVLLIGVGGIGLPALTYLASAGIGEIGMADNDTIDETNLNRQFLYSIADVGKEKVAVAKEKINQFNKDIKLTSINKLIDSNSSSLFKNYDVILDCTDNINSRHIINDLAMTNKKPLFFASASGYEARATSIIPKESACLRCAGLTITKDFVNKSCEDAGSIGAVMGIIGSIQALESIKYLIGIKPSLLNKMLLFDGNEMTFYEFKLKRNKTCKACSR